MHGVSCHGVPKFIEIVKEPKPGKPAGTCCVLEDSGLVPMRDLQPKRILACFHPTYQALTGPSWTVSGPLFNFHPLGEVSTEDVK